MNFPFYIARRYLVSKKSHNIINIISIISVIGIAVGTMALVIVLSVFNGFEGLIVGLFNSFNPDLKVTVREGKTFNLADMPLEKIRQVPGVIHLTDVVEENALAMFHDKQHIVTMKGVGEEFVAMTPLDSFMLDGSYILQDHGKDYAVIGAGVAYYLGIYPEEFSIPMTIYLPKRTRKNITGPPDQAFNSKPVSVAGVFALQQEFDVEYVIVPVGFARELLEYTDEATALEIGLSPGSSLDQAQETVQTMLGPDYEVKNRYQQQALLYRIMKSEKWAVFFILTFILVIAAFNMIGSLSMLILDKKKDIGVLRSLGANNSMIKRVFFTEGMLISLAGGIAGLILGCILVIIQQQFGLLKLGGGEGTFIIDAYPVKVKISDLIMVFLTVLLIGAATAWYPVRQIGRKYLSQRLDFFLMR